METVYSKFNSSTVSKCVSASENIPTSRNAHPLSPRPFSHIQVRQAGTMSIGCKFRNSCLEVLHENSSSENFRCTGPVLIKLRHEDL